LENLVNQKQILLKEIHHRVKNNLTTLKSLLFLQAKSSNNEEVKNILKECQLRIQSMALIHENLYEDAENEQVDFYPYLEKLFESLESSYKTENKNIEVDIEKNNVKLDISIAIFLGLVLNELATNSYKYAFVNQDSGKISLTLNKLGDKLEIIYNDNGCGLPDGFNTNSTGFGFKLIRILVEQINGKLEYNYDNNLSTFKITIDNV
jgi:two-component sensor histidine kinase